MTPYINKLTYFVALGIARKKSNDRDARSDWVGKGGKGRQVELVSLVMRQFENFKMVRSSFTSREEKWPALPGWSAPGSLTVC